MCPVCFINHKRLRYFAFLFYLYQYLPFRASYFLAFFHRCLSHLHTFPSLPTLFPPTLFLHAAYQLPALRLDKGKWCLQLSPVRPGPRQTCRDHSWTNKVQRLHSICTRHQYLNLLQYCVARCSLSASSVVFSNARCALAVFFVF